ncbi:MAG: hypothetical protein J6A22_01190 [Bacteroidales bacterium]|nr:hypothetical protein [Bacteroidales bacterium]
MAYRNFTSGRFGIRSLCRCLMEEGYHPNLEDGYVSVYLNDNVYILEYGEGIVSVMLFFSVDEEACFSFMQASNVMHLKCTTVKAVMLDDNESLMFRSEFFCNTVRQFRKFFPRSIEMLDDAVTVHRMEMKNLASLEPGIIIPERGKARKILS